jgi:protein-disulfide isomerase/uncharacterized membrane protein
MPSDIAPKPSPRPWIIAALVSAIGIGVAVELTQIHVRVHANPNTRSFCTLSEHISCDKTAQSAYAMFLNVPTSVWGLLGYAIVFVVAVLGWRSRRPFLALPLLGLSCVCALVGTLMAILSAVLHNLCILCSITWVVDFTLLAVSIALLRSIGWHRALDDLAYAWRRQRTHLIAAGIGALALVPVARALTSAAWGKPAAAAHVPVSLSDRARSGADANIPQGTDDAGHPYMGGSQPKLTIVEFADYQCPHCAAAHAEMRELLAKNARDIRIIHRHFPLDQQCNSLVQRPFHTHACDYAKMAVCAALAGKFWQANDYLFEHGRDPEPVSLDALARQLELDVQQLRSCFDTAGTEKVRADVEEGLSLKIQGTPTFVIDGKLYPGRVADEVLEAYQR